MTPGIFQAQIIRGRDPCKLVSQYSPFTALHTSGLAGDPKRLLHHLGLGVWSFVAEPTAGLLEGARGHGFAAFLKGVRSGTSALINNTIFAFSNATTKMSGAAHNRLLTLGLDLAGPANASAGVSSPMLRLAGASKSVLGLSILCCAGLGSFQDLSGYHPIMLKDVGIDSCVSHLPDYIFWNAGQM